MRGGNRVVEALTVSIFPGTARLDEQCLHANPAKPVTDRLGGELGSIVRPYMLGGTMLDEQVGQALQHIVRP